MDYKLELTFLELLFLDDSVTLEKRLKVPLTRSGVSENETTQGLRGINTPATLIVGEELILKIGSALLELNEKPGSAPAITFTKDELWLLRELADSRVYYGEEAVGLSLKLKAHKALRESAVEEFDLGNIVAKEEIGKSVILEKLEEFNASTNKDTDESPSEDSS